jgi:hypothetical protein
MNRVPVAARLVSPVDRTPLGIVDGFGEAQ